MNSLKKYIYALLLAVVLLLAAALAAFAAKDIYVNSAGSSLDCPVTEAWAVGADGLAQISADRVYALTAAGLTALNSPEDGSGGGELLFDGGSVRVAASKIKVALRYYYSEARDSSMDRAYLENADGYGCGYAFGYLDGRRFVPFGDDAVTAETRIDVRPLGGTGLGIYSTVTDELLYSVDATGADFYLAIHPLCAEGEAITWFAKNLYYGDFAYADLGNGKITVVNVVDIEKYVMGVCAGEMGAGFPREALKAQAVAARTYAMYNIHSGGYNIGYGFDVTNDDYSQVYLGYTDSAGLIAAAEETENQYLTYQGWLIDALFFAADGGATLDSEAVFANALPYLRGVDDPYEESAWTRGAYGHRVGMSQWGAYAMAQYYQKNYKDILGFYYTDVGLSYGYLQDE